MRIALLLVLLSGCFVVPSTRTTTRHVGFEASAEVRKGVARGLTVQMAVQHGDVVVAVVRTRDCHREILEVTEVREQRGLRMGGVDDPRGRAFGAMLAPVTLPVSFIISGLAVAFDRGDTHEQRTPHHVETTACTEPAGGIALDVELASGQRLADRTDAGGKLVFTIPAGEPPRGVVTVRAEATVAQLKYRRKSALAMRESSLGE